MILLINIDEDPLNKMLTNAMTKVDFITEVKEQYQ